MTGKGHVARLYALSFGLTRGKVRLTPWALYSFLVGLSAAAAIRKLPHTILT